MSRKRSVLCIGLAVAIVAAFALVQTTSSNGWLVPRLSADALTCNLSQYKAAAGLTATVEQGTLLVGWTGQNGADLRARYAIDGGKPVIRELAIKKSGGQWTALGRNLAPEYHVVSGIRRMALDQANPLRAAGLELTDGASLIVTFPGLAMGIFAGDLQFTVYKGTNLVRMDAAAKTSEPWVAYKYDAGLNGFSTDLTPRVAWRDTGGHAQSYQVGGVV